MARLFVGMAYNGVVIFVHLDVTQLGAGYRAIEAFLDAMRQEWLPGFERSYLRRTDEYRKALAKYEKRGLFLRTLLGKPKQPGHVPDLYPAQVEGRLWQGWHDAIGREDGLSEPTAVHALKDRLDDQFLALCGVRTEDDAPLLDVVIGPPGLLLLNADERAAAVVRSIQAANPPTPPVTISDSGEAWPPENAAVVIDRSQVYAEAERLLERHQALGGETPFSALAAAEKLTAQEKDRLLRMAATL